MSQTKIAVSRLLADERSLLVRATPLLSLLVGTCRLEVNLAPTMRRCPHPDWQRMQPLGTVLQRMIQLVLRAELAMPHIVRGVKANRNGLYSILEAQGIDR